MSPTCSKAALRVLISVLLTSGVANAAALRHQVLDTRDAAHLENAQIAAEALQAAASAVAEDPENFFEDVSDKLNNHSGYEWLRDFIARLFGPREGTDNENDNDNDNDDDDTVTTTVYVTPTPAPAETSAGAISSYSLGPTEVASSESSPTPIIPVFSILPHGLLTTAINIALPTPDLNLLDEHNAPSVPSIVAPFPLLNGSLPTGPLPTAVIITDEFSVTIPLATEVPTPASDNDTAPFGTGVVPSGTVAAPLGTGVAPLGTGVTPLGSDFVPSGTGFAPAWSYNVSYSAINPTLVTAPLAPTLAAVFNSTANETVVANITSVVVVTETVIPLPVLVTGTAPAAVSVGTGLPISDVGSPLWANSSYAEATAVAPLAGTGTGSPIIGTGSPIIGTGSPIIGTGSPSAGSALPAISESPLYPNTTTPTVVLPIPILVTGVPDAILFNETIPSAPANVTSKATVSHSLTAVPITVTGIPGSVLNIDVTIPLPMYPNVTVIEVPTDTAEAIAVSVEVSAAVSVGTGLPILAPSDVPLFPNTSTTTIESLVVETATAILILPPAPLATAASVESPGQSNVTLPLVLPTAGYGAK
jgi:hypothetical protein